MKTTIYEMDFQNGGMKKVQDAALQVKQIVWLNGYGQDQHSHERKAIYKISVSSYDGRLQYETVNLETSRRQTLNAYQIKPESKIFGIGIYYTPEDLATQEEIDEALINAVDLEKIEKADKERREREANRVKAKGQAIFEANKPEWAKSVIIAELHENDCDLHTDYFGYKTKKTVILAFSKHTRDLFPELRKAAAKFEQTRPLATKPLLNDSGEEKTEANKEWWTPSDEHREKYSMGSGYYLGVYKNNSGWVVSKCSCINFSQYYHSAGLDGGFYAFKDAEEEEKQQDPIVKQLLNKSLGSVTVRKNTDKNGIEIIFKACPAREVLDNLKKHGFRWSRFNKLWYSQDNEKNWNYAKTLIKQ